MATNPYISREQLQFILHDLNVQEWSEARIQDLLDRATGDLESDLARKFVVPLIVRGPSPYLGSPQSQNYAFAKAKVANAMKAKVRAVLGFDLNRNQTGVIESTQKFLNVAEMEYNGHIKDLLDQKIDYGFVLLGQAQDAQTPVMHIALSRADNDTDPHGGWGDGWR